MKVLIVTLCAVAVLVALPQAALAQGHDHAGNSPKAEFQISKPLVVGTATLAPGTYTFQCVFADGGHFLVVKSDSGEELARVPCREEQLTGKITTSDFRSVSQSDGTQSLTAVRIKGETIAHRLVLD